MFRGSCFIGKIVELSQMLYIRELYDLFIESVFYSSNEDRQDYVGNAQD
jgi:hypothetical protein